jgi:hypothetical protein
LSSSSEEKRIMYVFIMLIGLVPTSKNPIENKLSCVFPSLQVRS